MTELVFLKLGGSLITDKTRPYTHRPDKLAELAAEIAAVQAGAPAGGLRLVLGHGSGSFGHFAVKEHLKPHLGPSRPGGADPAADDGYWRGFAEVWYRASQLDRYVIEALHAAGVPVVALPASALVGARADYIVTGTWSKTALKEAQKLGKARAAADTEKDNFSGLPAKVDLDASAAYLHFTSNETIHGVEYFTEPETTAGIPLVCDASSDFISRPVDVSKYALIYAGAQKNAGPAGVTIVIARDDMLERTPANTPIMLDYKTLAASSSLHNTPPCFAIYITGLVFQWARRNGGLPEIAKRNKAKASLVYQMIDGSGGFYRGHAKPEARSVMNIPFRLPSEELEGTFASDAKKNDLIGLKGHRSVGGIRASLYNAITVQEAEELAKFMQEFQRTHG
jgi:phosphoserine aminotransferase